MGHSAFQGSEMRLSEPCFVSLARRHDDLFVHGVAYYSMSRAFRVEMCICNGQGRIIFPTGLSVCPLATRSMGMLTELMVNETERSTDRDSHFAQHSRESPQQLMGNMYTFISL